MNVDYVVTLSNQTVTTTPNFGSQTNNNFALLPLSPPCTGSFLTAVVDTSNLAIVLTGNATTYTRLVAQSCADVCVDSCVKNDTLTTAPRSDIWCLLIGNPKANTISLNVAYTFALPATTITVTPITSTTSPGATTTLITISVGVEKTRWNSTIVFIWLVCSIWILMRSV
ncbi:7419_t:CDS:2 [Paraglomus brasilianum]|uniref:7419_t:CDS:1 n=1 Tax=Paraglomus brasilianum TaxID=144538 RepID=A0A9N9GZ55_9GLOM|nr:7419_t:CDS:2 [Paraglomus brasilianum]